MAPDRTDPTEVELLDRLISALQRADEALRIGSMDEGDEALVDGLSVLGTLYGSLDPTTSPEASVHLEAVYDTCLRGLGGRHGGSQEALAGATLLLRSIRCALVPTTRVPPQRRAA